MAIIGVGALVVGVAACGGGSGALKPGAAPTTKPTTSVAPRGQAPTPTASTTTVAPTPTAPTPTAPTPTASTTTVAPTSTTTTASTSTKAPPTSSAAPPTAPRTALPPTVATAGITASALPTVDTDVVLTTVYTPAVKPSTLYLSGDSTDIVTGLHWVGWDSHGATGYGTVDVLSCNPDCATGASFPAPVTIYLNDPVNGAFSLLTEEIHSAKAVQEGYAASRNYTVPTS